MGTIRLMHAKLHRVRVSSANVNYIGSISIDRALLDRVGILPLEEVDIVNLTNGNRFSTYVIPGGTGEICPNGGAALLCQAGDILLIYAYEDRQRQEVLETGHRAKVFVADEFNLEERFFEQTLIPLPGKDGVRFQSEES